MPIHPFLPAVRLAVRRLFAGGISLALTVAMAAPVGVAADGSQGEVPAPRGVVPGPLTASGPALASESPVSAPATSTAGTISSTVKLASATNGGPELSDNAYFGWSTAGLGDMNGDGVPDLAIGAPFETVNFEYRGAVYVAWMKADGTISSTVQLTHLTNGGPATTLQGYFGAAVTALGDLNGDGVTDLAIGEPSDQYGTVHIAFMNADGTISSTVPLTSGTNGGPWLADGDSFGTSLAAIGDLDGNGVTDLAIGARFDNTGGDVRGAVHIAFMNADGTISSTVELASGLNGGPALADNDQFGTSVAALGDLNSDGVPDLAIGAPYDSLDGVRRGAVYLAYLNANGTISSTVRLASDTNGGPALTNYDFFGHSLAPLGDLNVDGVPDLLIGAKGDDTGGSTRGAAYIAYMSANGTISSTVKLASDTNGGPALADGDVFGESAAAIGDLNGDGVPELAIGANGDDTGGLDRGAVYVAFLESATTPDEVITGLAADNSSPTELGASTSLTATITAGSGVSYAWAFGDGATGSGANPTHTYGAVGAYTAIVTATNSLGSLSASTAVTITDVLPPATGSISSSVKLAHLTNGGPELSDGFRFGQSVASLGDFNGDGVPDLAIGAWSERIDTVGQRGALHIAFMKADGTISSTVPLLHLTNAGPESDPAGRFGTPVSALGDINGDGVIDLAVGEPGVDHTGYEGGAAHVLFMKADGTISSTVKLAHNTNGGPALGASDYFGAAVAGLGDLNGDGVPDLAIGAPYDNTGGDWRGAVHIAFMKADGTISSTVKLAHNTNGGPALADWDNFGWSLAGLGDLNGDGVPDLAIGAFGNVNAVYIALMNADGTISNTVKLADGINGAPPMEWGNEFGKAIAPLGDLNGDGVTDLAIGVHGDSTGGDARGAVLVAFMNADGTISNTVKLASDTNGGPALADWDMFGSSVASLGDLNGDGAPELAVGAAGDDTGGSERGAVYVAFLNAGEPAAEEAITGLAADNSSPTELGASTSLTATITAGSGVSYAWAFGDGATGSGANPTHTYSAVGAYTAIVTATNSLGSLSASTAVTITDVPVAGLFAFNDGPKPVGASVTFTQTLAAGTNVAYAWSFGDGATGTGAVVTHTYAATGTYTAIVTATNSSSGGVAYTDVTITAPPGGGAPGTAGSTVKLAHLTNGGPELGFYYWFGQSVASLGDFNGDGVTDLALGTPWDYTSGDGGGAVFVAFMNADGTISSTVKLADSFNGGPDLVYGAEFGSSLAALGDLNGDGVTDLAIGAQGVGPTGSDDGGAVYIAFMQADGTISSTVRLANGVNGAPALAAADYFGSAVAGLGDVNGDGLPDLAIGAVGDDTGGIGYGAAYIAFMQADGTISSTVKLADGMNGVPALEYGHFGWSLAALGDWDGNGVPDLAIGARADSNGGYFTARGAVHMAFLNADGTVASTVKLADSFNGGPALADSDFFGSAVALLGDLNGDSVPDLAIGAMGDDTGGSGSGAAYIALMNADGTISSTVKLTHNTNGGPALADSDYFGASLAGLGDLDGNGVPDVAIGAYGDDTGNTDSGAVYVTFMDGAASPDEAISGLAADNSSPTELGQSTALTATITAGSGVSYAWAFGDGATGSGANPTHTYSAVGAYTAIVTATNSLGSLSASTAVTITDVPVAGLFAFNDGPKQAGTGVLFTTTLAAGTNVSYAWSFGDGASGTGATVVHTYTNAGSYTAIVTATNSSSAGAAYTGVSIMPVQSIVLNANNSGAGSLRQVLADAPPGATVVFTPSLNGQTINLSTGGLTVTKTVTVDGAGLAITVTNPGGLVFLVQPSGVLHLKDFTIANSGSTAGLAPVSSAGRLSLTGMTLRGNGGVEGGAILSEGASAVLTVTASAFISNTATMGGAIHHRAGRATISGSTFSGNTASWGGGAIASRVETGTNLILAGNVFTANTAGNGGGGAIFSENTLASTGDLIQHNATTASGGAVVVLGGSAVLSGTQLISNTAATHGGGLGVFGGAAASLTNVTITQNYAASEGGGAQVENAALTAAGGEFSLNRANLSVGGGLHIWNSTVGLSGTVIMSNTATHGAGLAARQSARTTLTSVWVHHNTSSSAGGGILNESAVMTVTRSTVSHNSGAHAGGIQNLPNAALTLANSTVSANTTAGWGGGIRHESNGALTLVNVTLSGNSGTSLGGGNLHVYSATLAMTNTVSANSASGADCHAAGGGSVSTSFSQVESGGCGLPASADPRLGSLLQNGGLAPTHAPLNFSPLLNAAAAAACAAAPVGGVDQRGVARPQGGGCDVGAVESLVALVNPAPTANTDAYVVAEDGVLVVPAGTGVLANDTDTTSTGGLTATLVYSQAPGTLSLSPNGAFTYTPTLGYVGAYTFTYRVFDGYTFSAPGVISITLTPAVSPYALPMTGKPQPSLAVFDTVMQQFMQQNNIPAGALVVMRQGQVVFEHGYGWKDAARTQLVQPSALFRIGGVTKPFAAAALRELAGQSVVNLSDKVFCQTQQQAGCWLRPNDFPPAGTPDARIYDVTLQHLLDHTGGWDTASAGDPVFQYSQVRASLGLTVPVGTLSPAAYQTAITRYMLGQPLQHNPGSTYAYSNFGYLLAGLVVEKATGRDFSEYLQTELLTPLGIANTEVLGGRTLPQFANPREVYYADCCSGASVFTDGVSAPRPYGAWYLEAMESHGGLIATGRALASFANAYRADGSPNNSTGYYGSQSGSLDGTSAALLWRGDVLIAVMFDTRNYPVFNQPFNQLIAAANSVAVWPAAPPAGSVTAPQAAPDSFALPGGLPSHTLNVLANDSDADGPQPLAITAVGAPSAGGLVETRGNRVIYTPAGPTALNVFTYTISDGSHFSTAAVTTTLPAGPSVCSEADLLNAISAGGTGTISLNPLCVYELTSASSADGIAINQAAVLEGNGATIRRGAGAPDRRLLLLNRSGLVVRNLTLENGLTSGYGGGLLAVQPATLENVALTGNQAGAGGALGAGASLTLRGVTFNGNRAGNAGGAVLFIPGSGAVLSVLNSTFISNTAARGGAIYLQGANLAAITNTVFAENTAGLSGASIFANDATSSVRIVHSTIGDIGQNAGQAVFAWGSLDVRSSIVANHAFGLAVAGGSGVVVTEDYNLFAGNNQDLLPYNATPITRGGHSLAAALPGFVNPAGRDYHLRHTSPAIDLAANTTVAADRDGAPRPYSGTAPDAGAYEYQGQGTPAVQIVKSTLGPPWIAVNQVFTFSLAVINQSTFTATHLAVSEVLPAGAVYISGSASAGGVLTGTDSTELNWTLASLGPRQTQTLTYQLRTAQTVLVSSQYQVYRGTDNFLLAAGAVLTTPVKNIVGQLDFIPNPDGFSFHNYGDSQDGDLTTADMIELFGEAQVCKTGSGATCVLTAAAEQWRLDWLERSTGGHCFGMAVSSLEIFRSPALSPADVQVGAAQTFDLTKPNARGLIMRTFLLQGTYPLNRTGVSPYPLAGSANAVADVLIANFNNPSAPDRYVLGFFKAAAAGGGGGHAVTPYAVERVSPTEDWIYVYDNNYPNNFDRVFKINRTTNSWVYEGGTVNPGTPPATYYGTAPEDNMVLMSMNYFTRYPKVCEFCAPTGGLAAAAATTAGAPLEFQLTGEGYLLVTRSDGLRYGYDLTTGAFINEIQDASSLPAFTGMGLNYPDVLVIPHVPGMTYKVEVSNAPTALGNANAPVELSLYAPGFVAKMNGLTLNGLNPLTGSSSLNDRVTLNFDPDQKQLTFTTSGLDAEVPQLLLAVSPGSGADYTLTLNDVDLGSGQSVLLGFDTATGQFNLENNSSANNTYSVAVERLNGNGTTNAYGSNALQDGSGVGVILHLGAGWNGSAPPVVTSDTTPSLPSLFRVLLPVALR